MITCRICLFENQCRQIITQERLLPLEMGPAVHLIRTSSIPQMACMTQMAADLTLTRIKLSEEYRSAAQGARVC